MNPDHLPASPIENASFLSKVFFCWLLDFFRLGSKRDLELSDLYRLSKEARSENLGNKLADAWKNQIHQAEKWNSMNKGKPRTPSLLRALSKVFFWQYAVIGLIAFFEECVLKIAQPIFLGLIIRYCAGEYGDVSGYLFTAGLLVSSALYTTHHHPYFFLTLYSGMKIRVACSSLLYRKSLKLSQAAIGKTNVGQLVNLLSNDVNRFDLSVAFLHYLWVGPIQLGIVIYILWGYYGWTCLVGVSVLILFVPFQSLMGRLFGVLRLKVAERTDNRVRIMSEIVNAIRLIKVCAWEFPFAKLVGEAREDEINYVRKTAFLRAVNLSCYYISSKIIIFLTLLTYVLTGNYLNAEKVFVTLSLYNNVRLILTLFVPNGVSMLAESLVSIRRLQDFLLMEEREMPPRPIEPLSGTKNRRGRCKEQVGGEISVTNLSARWTKTTNSEANTLEGISLKVREGQLLAVVGPVGSGKTSLLQVLLHELPSSSGVLQIKGQLAYTCQEPWIFSGTVRDNILFGRDFEYDRYHRCIQACALAKDMTLLPFQDQTLVGDRGTSLSGGQKARINLARAVYSDADIYLLDDPLSAVDAEVAKHIFENCIMGVLKDKAKVLVTHQLQFLKPADEIILLGKGKIEAQGTYKDLLKTGINFTQALQTDENATPKHEDNQSNPALALKMKGMGYDTQHGASPFRRSASMSLLELGAVASAVIPEEFEWEDEPIIVKSYGRQYDSRRDSRALLPRFKKPKNEYGTFSSGSSSGSEGSGESKPLIQQQHEELRSSGNIGMSLYWTYISAGASWFGLLLLLVSNILVQLLFSGSDYWLQYWTKVEENRTPITEQLAKLNGSSSEMIMISEKPVAADKVAAMVEESRTIQVYIYCGLVAALFVVSLIRNSAFLNICLNSSIELHRRLFHGVMRASMRFFEVNPAGRVLNRFAKDIGIVDEMLPITLFDTVDIALQVVGVVTIVSVNNPYLLIPSLFLAVIFYYIRKFYLKTARSVKRLEGIARSPVFSHLSTSLYGLTTIRAMGVENQFEQQFDAHQDLHSASWFLFLATARWLGIFVDWCCVIYIGIVSFTFLLTKGDESSSAVGLSIASAMSLTGMFQWGVRQSAETENQMVSVERIQEYAEIESEAPLDSRPGNKPPATWPSNGEIVFKNLVLKYGNESPVLKNITCVFKSQEKVGIVGRTGAGKSSLITALFRITEPHKGDIEIDGWSILRLGLHDLRNKISIIPQDPVLFNSTLRRNLDPFGDYKDEEIWNVLEEVYLADTARESPAGLDTVIAEGGSNFSVGQRQLICLGRACLRRNKILVLDEATANVDHETDALIQKTIREKLATCTVLTIAHRLHTVMDSDRILVLDAGEIKEFDEPYNLLLNEESSLSQLVATTGKATAANLFRIAKASHEKRHHMDRVLEVNENESADSGSNSSLGSPEPSPPVMN